MNTAAESADVIIVDYGLGNLRSVLIKLARAGYRAEISDSPERVDAASKLILPGVGSFERGAANLRERRLDRVLNEAVIDRQTPILGICLGMQLFLPRSDEGGARGLGWIEGRVKRFQGLQKPCRVPHVGQNTVERRDNEPLFNGLSTESYFYFTHSYHVECPDEFIVGTTHHGYEFPAAIKFGNIHGVQFHPEKSHQPGLTVLRNFLEL